MKKLSVILLGSFILASFSFSTATAQKLGDRVAAMQNRRRTDPAKNTVFNNNTIRNTRMNRRNDIDRDYDRRENRNYHHDNGLHRGWYKNNKGKQKGLYKINKGNGRKHD